MLLQLIVSLIGILVIAKAIKQLKNNEFTLFQFLIWLVIWGLAAYFVFFPDASNTLADFIGVGRGSDALVYLSVLALFYGFYRVYIKIEKIERNLTKLVRHEAIKNIKKKK